MKKVNYLIGIFALIIIMACSCEKENVTPDPDPVDEGLITLAELDGQWNFQGFKYNGVIYDDNPTTPPPPPSLMDAMFIDQEYTVSNMEYSETVSNMEYSESSYIFDFTKDVNEIVVLLSNGYDSRYIFTVTYYHVTGNVAELHLRVDQTTFTYNYLGGELILSQSYNN